ncbi:TonB-dependent receptor [Ferruginibacter sp.]|nr:TonB-dependent receptor [Ferruginibacter sp.]
MKKYFLLSSSVILFVLAANASDLLTPLPKTILKGNFSGKITDVKTGKPVAAATIYITDVKIGSASDNEGNFIIKNIPDGNHLVEISHVGYTTIAESVNISGDTKKDFILTESVVENNAVIVTGVSGATQLKKVPFAITVLRRQDFFQNTSTNIIESLTKIGGVSTLSTGPAISKPVIRGLSYNRVLTVNDGVRQEGQQWGDEHGIEVDEASVSKIELLKGPASIIYGSDAMAGVVNIITNVPVQNNTIKANFSSNVQTNNKLRTLNANIGGNKNGFNWNLYSSNKAAADYRNKYDGYVYNSKFNEHNIGGYAGINGDWGYSHLLVSNFNLKAGLVEGERDIDGYFIKPVAGGGETRATDADFKSTTPQIPYQHIRHFKIAADNNIKIGKDHLTFNIGFQQNQREEFGNIDDLNERALYFDLKTVTYTAQYHLAEKKGWKTSIGVNGMQQGNTNKGIEQLIPDYNLFDFGTYAYTKKEIKKITISGGVRYDTRNIDVKNLLDGNAIKGTGFKKSFSNISGSIGLAAQATDKLNFKLNIARGFRAPSIPELASNGAHEGTNRYEYGDAGLKSETSLQFDGGFDYSAEHLSIGISSFYNSFSNFIFYNKLEAAGGGDSLVNVNGDIIPAFKFNQRKASLAGFEAKLDIHPHPLDWLHIENSFSFVSGKFAAALDGSKNIPFIPAPKLVTELRSNFDHLKGAVHNFYVKLELDNTFTQRNIFTAYDTETKTTGYSLLNLGVGADFVNKKEQALFSLSLSALNITDVAYQNHLSRLKYAAENLATGRTGVFNMGRNFSIKLNVPLSFKF